MKTPNSFAEIFFDEQGAVAVIVAILASVLLGFAAFAVDLPNIMVAINELQNAADAGALAGARFLYSNKGQTVNTGANTIASDAAQANFSQRAAVEVQSIERGHWSFSTKIFTPNNSLLPVNLWNVSTDELDANLNFINALRVTVARSATPVASFFARIFGNTGFAKTAVATAYIGFAGTVEPMTFDEPIAICAQSITFNDKFTCNVGRMLNDNTDTAAWTNFEQPCSGAASASALKDILSPCPTSGANVNPVVLGSGTGIEATNGVDMSVFKMLYNCWMAGKNDGVAIDTNGDGVPDQPWKMTLPVVDCPNGKVSNCLEVRGAVEVNVVWILEKANDAAPYKMGNWSSTNTNDATRWSSFVQFFHLQNSDGTPATKEKKTIYFQPDCTPHEPTGTTGGENYGILAAIPVLVK